MKQHVSKIWRLFENSISEPYFCIITEQESLRKACLWNWWPKILLRFQALHFCVGKLQLKEIVWRQSMLSVSAAEACEKSIQGAS